MKKMKLISFVLAGAMMLSTFTVSFAAKFDDVTETYSWASEAIEEMAEDGIIKGYEDGSFRPANPVTKLESLVLSARILGISDAANEELVSVFAEKYDTLIAKYELPYGNNEIAYLLGIGVISEDEVDSYISNADRAQGLKRYELAVLLTKNMSAEEKVKQNLVSVLDYADEADIPSFAKKYVEYVTEQGLMQGMSATEFSPNTTVNRAQMALVLYKLQNLVDVERLNAVVKSVDDVMGIIKLEDSEGTQYSYTLTEDSALRFEGEKIAVKDISAGYKAVITTKNAALASIDFITPDIEEIFSGSVVSVVKNPSTGTMITFNKFTAGENTEEVKYYLSDTAKITYESEKATVDRLSVGSFAYVTIEKGKIEVLEAMSKTQSVGGTVAEVFTDERGVVISILDKEDYVTEYVAKSDVTVSKNSKTTATLSDVHVGDSVSVTLEYGLIKKIVATSRTTSKTGFIEEIHITNSPFVVIKMDGESKKYPLSSGVEILINGNKGTIYDLRLSTSANVTLDSETITKIDTTAASTIAQITGTVDLVNASYNFLQITYYDSTMQQNITQQVYVNKNTTIMNNSTGKDVSLKNIPIGSSVSIIGSATSGLFEATTIIVIG